MGNSHLASKVRKHFGPIAEDTGFEEVFFARDGLVEKIVYLSREKLVAFVLELREGEIDVRYGQQELLSERNGSYTLAYSQTSGLVPELRRMGVEIPVSERNLYADGVLEQTVVTLVKAILERKKRVLGVED